jgi:pyridoxal phosphate enzyme (YggS family)
MINLTEYQSILKSLPASVQLVAVSKTHSAEDLLTLYQAGQRIFGENKVQELCLKQKQLPQDIAWHFIGHLQTNKIKQIAPFIALIHSIDSYRLLQEVNRHASQYQRIIPCLLQFHIAREESKQGFSLDECEMMFKNANFYKLKNIEIQGIMGMASFTDDTQQIHHEFQGLHQIFEYLKKYYFEDQISFQQISMGMSNDYLIAIEEGSTMIRIGSILFGNRFRQ